MGMNFKKSVRMFDAGSVDRLTMSWDSTNYNPDQVLYHQLPLLRARARHQSRNNDYVVRLIQLLQSNVVGAFGFKARSQVMGVDGKPDLEKRKNIEQLWNDFVCESDFIEIQNVIMAAMVSDGEAFVHLHTCTNGQLHIELIDPARIDTEFNRNDGTNTVVMGIEYDAMNKPVAYWVTDKHDYHPAADAHSPIRTKIPAENILHIFKKSFVGQRRGFPWIAPSLARLFQLAKFEEAALMAARIGASKMGFFYNESNDEYTGDGSDDMSIQAEAGTFENIGSMRFQQFDPTYPSGEFKEFVEKILKGISSGWGVDYHSVGNDLAGVNYSSARVGMLETREYYKTLQQWLTHKLIKPTFDRWLYLEALKGNIEGNLHSLSPVQFVGRRWDWVDPNKEVQAKQLQHQMNVLSLSQIIRERGDDPADVFAEIAQEKALMKELGITPEDVINKIKEEDNAKEQDRE